MLTELVEHLRILLSGVFGFQTLSSEIFLFRPFVLLVVLGVAGGLVSVIVNLHQLEFNAETTVHAIFPGIVAGAVFWGIEAINAGAVVVGVCVTAALTWNSWRKTAASARAAGHAGSEAGTAVILTSFFSVGVVLSLKKGDMSGQLEALMFGRLLEVTDSRMAQSVLACMVAVVLLALTWRRQVFVAFDRDGAKAAGVNMLLIDLTANVAITAVVIAGSSAVGTLLVIGYLIVPGATGKILARSVRGMCLIAVGMGVVGGYIGMVLMNVQSSHPISPQGAVALSVVGIFFVALIIKRLCARIQEAVAKKRPQISSPVSEKVA